jgi:mono/diheme cytochrome c family protein
MIIRWFGLAIALASIPTAVLAQNAPTRSTPSAVMKTYCASCHSDPVPKGGFSLDRVDVNNPAKDVEAWERVVRQLRAHTMPVVGAARLDGKTYETMISALTDAMDRVAVAGKPLTEREIAFRLARLVWNTEPDPPLLDAAAKGQLHDTEVLQTQVRRMLGDSKSSAFVTGFFGTWLSLDQLTTMKRDSGLFPEFDDELRSAMRRETELFIESQLRDDSNPLDLWSANYTFLNERLAKHYGLPGITGPEYRRVIWPGSERAGLLGQGSILTLTSYLYNAYPVEMPTTSPAQRAKWILTRALGVNPPATVQNVPSADFPFTKHTPLVAQSRTFPATPCLACHRAFFPLSYGLENFDVLGRWRTDYGPGAINASGSMVDGTVFNGPVELRRVLLERSDAFLNLLAEKLLAYASGGPSAIDQATPPARMPIVRRVLRESKAPDYSWSSLIAAIAKVPSDAVVTVHP